MFKPRHPRYRVDQGKYCIDLMMTSPHQLFDERDPAPFRERDLDEDAIDYIVGSIQELPENSETKIVLTFPQEMEFVVQTHVLSDAIHSFFDNESEKASRDINFLMRQGESALLVGVLFLGVCLFVSNTLIARPSSLIGLALHEGLTIIGWVAMWRPLNIFLYDWWPILTRRAFYKRIVKSEIEVRFVNDRPVSVPS